MRTPAHTAGDLDAGVDDPPLSIDAQRFTSALLPLSA
jgi:hypothetical protein